MASERQQRQRAITHKRRRAIGFLRPNVLLYGENCPNEVGITDTFNHDLAKPIDAVLIVGTRLSIPSLAGFAERLCKVVRANSNLVIWSRFNSLCGLGLNMWKAMSELRRNLNINLDADIIRVTDSGVFQIPYLARHWALNAIE
ncbi:hypothetical protein EDB81DRAFT_767532 [Dactylonectria macrodidyma]|uniref:Deacetylase sirtuin-type domain-containing protein n=1 Tax=Dactylonectria macrodidyma TaxID=307937 RepID=A0A9P9DAV5_9HYPO|nr:hypothetical protein EDB81DRAFT_767532 [Dactylonectria macrodidyma]